MTDTVDITANILARYRRQADMADTADILARYRREGADTSSVEAGRNSIAPHQEHTATGVPTNGAAVTGGAVIGAANGAAETGAAVIGIRTHLGVGAFLTHLTTAMLLMGITLRIRTDLVIPTTGVGTHIGGGAILTCTRTTAIILRIGTLMTIAPYQEGDSFDP